MAEWANVYTKHVLFCNQPHDKHKFSRYKIITRLGAFNSSRLFLETIFYQFSQIGGERRCCARMCQPIRPPRPQRYTMVSIVHNSWGPIWSAKFYICIFSKFFGIYELPDNIRCSQKHCLLHYFLHL